jgi:hypothetical protein
MHTDLLTKLFLATQDIDILCLTPHPRNVEDIKEQICEADDRFYLKQGRQGDYKVLHWRIDDDDEPDFKIDILLPGTLDLPDVSPNYIIKIQRLPCAPLVLLLLHKLKAWDNRRRSDPSETGGPSSQGMYDISRTCYASPINAA